MMGWDIILNREGLTKMVFLNKYLNELIEMRHVDIWEGNNLSRENSQGHRHCAGVCLSCFKSSRKLVWLKQSEQGR